MSNFITGVHPATGVAHRAHKTTPNTPECNSRRNWQLSAPAAGFTIDAYPVKDYPHLYCRKCFGH